MSLENEDKGRKDLHEDCNGPKRSLRCRIGEAADNQHDDKVAGHASKPEGSTAETVEVDPGSDDCEDSKAETSAGYVEGVNWWKSSNDEEVDALSQEGCSRETNSKEEEMDGESTLQIGPAVQIDEATGTVGLLCKKLKLDFMLDVGETSIGVV